MNAGAAPRSLSAEPTFVVGEGTDDPDLLVAQVMGAVRLPDGGVVVADQETRLRWFNADGSLRFEAGGKGQGPGEFEFIFGLERCGADTLHVAAPGDQVSVYSLEGEYLEKIVWDFPVNQHQTACDREGNVVATGWGPFPSDMPAEGGATLYRADTQLMILRNGATESFDVRSVPSAERVLFSRGAMPHPFGRMTRVAVGGARVFLGLAESFEIEVYNLDGIIQRRIRRADLEPEPVTWADVERLVEVEPERLSAERLEIVRQADLPPTQPAYEEMRLDPTGLLWVRHFRAPGEQTVTWSIFDRSGVWQEDAVFPRRLTVLEIGSDYVLGVWKDDLDEESIRVYALSRQ